MRFVELPLKGAFAIYPEPIMDGRGSFARMFCRHEFEEHGLNPEVAQCNFSRNLRLGTLRGLHYQVAPFEETKLVRCNAGSLFDVIVDLRPDSPTFRRWYGMELDASAAGMIYVPGGFAHGYQSLAEHSEVMYLASQFYAPAHERGVRWDDPALAIQWPIKDPLLSEKDRAYADLD
jgi:dTDP-4-dehydrorhamnose 3,5-epimerase